MGSPPFNGEVHARKPATLCILPRAVGIGSSVFSVIREYAPIPTEVNLENNWVHLHGDKNLAVLHREVQALI